MLGHINRGWVLQKGLFLILKPDGFFKKNIAKFTVLGIHSKFEWK